MEIEGAYLPDLGSVSLLNNSFTLVSRMRPMRLDEQTVINFDTIAILISSQTYIPGAVILFEINKLLLFILALRYRGASTNFWPQKLCSN